MGVRTRGMRIPSLDDDHGLPSVPRRLKYSMLWGQEE